MKEKWKWVIEDYYRVSDWGRVRSVDRVVPHARFGTWKRKGRILRLAPGNNGYLEVSLCKDGVRQTRLVHRLVAEAFLGPCPEGQQVRHLDSVPTNNRLDNLRYGTPLDDYYDRVEAGTVYTRSVKRSDGKEYASIREAASDSGCRPCNICSVCNGRQKTSGGFSWKYLGD